MVTKHYLTIILTIACCIANAQTTRLSDRYCNRDDLNVNRLIRAERIQGAVLYEFMIMDTKGNELTSYQHIQPFFRLSDLDISIKYNTPYSVKVRAQVKQRAGMFDYVIAWTEWGKECTIKAENNRPDWIIPSPGFDGFHGANARARDETHLIPAFCDRSNIQVDRNIWAYFIPFSFRYEFRIMDINGDELTTYQNSWPYFRLTETALQVQFNTLYRIQVRALKLNGWTEWGEECYIRTQQVETNLTDRFCNDTGIRMNGFLMARPVPRAQEYIFRFSDEHDSVHTVYQTRRALIRLEELPDHLNYNTTYHVDVRAKVAGIWSDYGPVCSITTEPHPLSQLTPPVCNADIDSLNQPLETGNILYADVYEFTVMDDESRVLEVHQAGDNVFSLDELDMEVLYNKTYRIAVRTRVDTKTDTSWSGYGDTCSVRVPRVASDVELASLCTFDPDEVRGWRIYNPNDFALEVDYEVAGGESGTVYVPREGEARVLDEWAEPAYKDYTFFTTPTAPGDNTMTITYGDYQTITTPSGGDTCDLGFTSVCTVDPDYTRGWRIENPSMFPVEARYHIYPDGSWDTVITPPAGYGRLKYETATDGHNYTFVETPTVPGQNTAVLEYGEDESIIKASGGAQCKLQLTSVCSYNPACERRWRIRNPSPFEVKVRYEIYSNKLWDSLVVKPAGLGVKKYESATDGHDYTFFSTRAFEGPNTLKVYYGLDEVTTKASNPAQCFIDNIDDAYEIDIYSTSSWCSDPCGFTTAGLSGTGPSFTCGPYNLPNNNIWYQFKAPHTGEVRVKVMPDGLTAPVVALWSDPYDTPLECRALPLGVVSLNYTGLTQDSTYYISVDNGLPGSQGAFGICLYDRVYTGGSPITLSATTTPDYGDSTGTINLTVNGGISPYTYIWSHGPDNVQDPQNVPTGYYDVTVVDNEGVTAELDSIYVPLVSADDINLAMHVPEVNQCNTTFNVTATLSNNTNNPSYVDQLIMYLPSGVEYVSTSAPMQPDAIQYANDTTILTWNLTPGFVPALHQQAFTVMVKLGNKKPAMTLLAYTSRVMYDNELVKDAEVLQDITQSFPVIIINPLIDEPLCRNATQTLMASVQGVANTNGYDFTWIPENQHTPYITFEVEDNRIDTVMVTDPAGCSAKEIAVTTTKNIQNDIPQLDVMVDVDCEVPEAVLSLPFDGNYTWHWYEYPYQPLVETPGPSYTVAQSGVYGVVVRTRNCAGASKLKSVTLGNDTTIIGFTADKTKISTGRSIAFTINGYDDTYTYTWKWGDYNSNTETSNQTTHTYYRPGMYTIFLTGDSRENCDMHYAQGTIEVYRPLCRSSIPVDVGGSFYVDNTTGRIVFKKNNCPGDELFNCFRKDGDGDKVRVVSASSKTFFDEWGFDTSLYKSQYGGEFTSPNNFEQGKKGKARVTSQYAYKTKLTDKSYNYNYEYGTFLMQDFNYHYEEDNHPSHWVKATNITRYTPNGDAIAEKNALDIRSIVKYGYHGSVPYLVASNTTKRHAHYVSFENVYHTASGRYLESGRRFPGGEIDNTVAHTGKQSLKLTVDKISLGMIKKPYGWGHAKAYPLIIKFWVKTDNPEIPAEDIAEALNVTVLNMYVPVTVVSQVGEWSLCEARITKEVSEDYPSFYIAMDLERVSSTNAVDNATLWIDDIKMQYPFTQMKAFVYDTRTLRLLAEFDDQHFATFYQYNEEGKLVRKMIETERGMQTIQETQYHTITQPK